MSSGSKMLESLLCSQQKRRVVKSRLTTTGQINNTVLCVSSSFPKSALPWTRQRLRDIANNVPQWVQESQLMAPLSHVSRHPQSKTQQKTTSHLSSSASSLSVTKVTHSSVCVRLPSSNTRVGQTLALQRIQHIYWDWSSNATPLYTVRRIQTCQSRIHQRHHRSSYTAVLVVDVQEPSVPWLRSSTCSKDNDHLNDDNDTHATAHPCTSTNAEALYR